MPTSIKIDPNMKQALEKLAKERFVPVSSLIKQAVARFLDEEGVDWKKEAPEPRPKK
ncbi:MAG: ribbon-helix-helix domain-containing protein [Pseudomonadota bacterium]